MRITRFGPILAIAVGLVLGGCAGLQPSPVVLKNEVQPVLRTQGAEMSADAYYQAGRRAMRSGDLVGARKFFSQALLQDPNYVDAINAMAAILTVQGRYGDSLELMRQAVERAPHDAMYRRNLERVEKLLAREQAVKTADGAGPAGSGSGSAGQSPVANVNAEPAAVVAPVAVATIDESGARPYAAESARVVEVAPNVYSLQVPEHRMMAAGRGLAPTRDLSAAWIRTTDKPAVAPSPEAQARAGVAGGLTTVSYRRDSGAVAPLRVMVTNGMGRQGWASRHAGLLGAMGMTPARITNHAHFGVTRTLIRFRAGLRDEAERVTAAVATLAGARLVEDDALPAGIDLQVILGKDSQPARQRPTT